MQTFVEKVQARVREAAELLIEDHDIEPAVWIQSKDGAQTYVSLDKDLFASGMTKEILFRFVVPSVVKNFDAARFAFVAGAWQVETKDVERAKSLYDSGKGISDEPDRREIITMNAYDPDTEACFVASVKRNPGKTAEIGEWERFSMESTTGRFRKLWDAMK